MSSICWLLRELCARSSLALAVTADTTGQDRLVQALGPEVVERMHQRVVGVAREKKVVRGRKMRVDTMVVETNIHYPNQSEPTAACWAMGYGC